MLHIRPSNPLFPKQLLQPNLNVSELFIKSNNWSDLINKPLLAVVGSRKVSPYGQAICQQLVRELASRGVVIVSGLALGIDSIAHSSAIEVAGKTIAVLPGGLNNVVPVSHTNLANNITDTGGALISEHTPNTKISFKGAFVARNRIIAGLSTAILIPEASERSGSLHTANFGLDLGKDILAVPGPINSVNSMGCNNLIKSGAHIVTSVEDVLQILKIQPLSHNNKPEIIANNKEEKLILDLITSGITDADELLIKSNLSAIIFNQTLSMLEISGRVIALGGNNWSIK